MNFPPEWKTKGKEAKHTGSKRHKAGRGGKEPRDTPASDPDGDSRPHLLVEIQNKLNMQSANTPNERMGIDNVVNTIPYKEIINNVFENHTITPPNIPTITRAYEESFMREFQKGHERACANGDACECTLIDAGNQFVGVEFLLPFEHPGENPNLCVLCQRELTQKLYFDIMFDGKAFPLPIQKYGNIFNQPGEYAREVMLACPANGPLHCMPCPIVSHQRNRYLVYKEHGLRRLKQHNVSLEDYSQYSRINGGVPTTARVCNIHPRYRVARDSEQAAGNIQTVPMNDAVMSNDLELNERLKTLYDEMFRVNPDRQVEIDSYIYAALVLRDEATARRLRDYSGCISVVESLRTPPEYTIHRDTLPDLGNIIRRVVFFSGNRPLEPPSNNTPVYSLIYEALPNIKRTKQVKNKANTGKRPEEMHYVSAAVSVMLGTLLALYPNSAKAVKFERRCDIVEMLHGIQCLTQDAKVELLEKTPHLTKLCFMEYVPWFIKSYLPVEMKIISKSHTTSNFLRLCPSICDMFRQDMSQIESLDIHKLDRLAAQAIERCTRLCKFKMQRHEFSKEVVLPYPSVVDKASFLRAMGYMTPLGFMRGVRKVKNILPPALDTTRDLHLLHPDAHDAQSILYASILQQHLQVFALPCNIREQQQRVVDQLYPNCSLLNTSARMFHVCMTCILQGKTHRPTFRISLVSNKLQCNTCKNDFSVARIDMVGSVIYFGGRTIAMCTGCGSAVMNHGDGVILSGKCARCSATAPHPDERRNAMCMRCTSVNTSMSLMLMDSSTMCMRQVVLCSKHAVSAALRDKIHDVSQLI